MMRNSGKFVSFISLYLHRINGFTSQDLLHAIIVTAHLFRIDDREILFIRENKLTCTLSHYHIIGATVKNLHDQKSREYSGQNSPEHLSSYNLKSRRHEVFLHQ
jgi:hypothetical protein